MLLVLNGHNLVLIFESQREMNPNSAFKLWSFTVFEAARDAFKMALMRPSSKAVVDVSASFTMLKPCSSNIEYDIVKLHFCTTLSITTCHTTSDRHGWAQRVDTSITNECR